MKSQLFIKNEEGAEARAGENRLIAEHQSELAALPIKAEVRRFVDPLHELVHLEEDRCHCARQRVFDGPTEVLM